MKTSLWTPGSGVIDRVMQAPVSLRGTKGMELVNLAELGILPGVGGGRYGANVQADVVTQTSDGRDLNGIWDEFMALLNAVNGGRQSIINFLTFSVQNPNELVAQAGSGVDFEDATEFGEPQGRRVVPTYFNMGYTFKWYDLGARYTWQYLADAPAYQVEAVANAAVEAYWRKLMFEVLKCVFNNNNLVATINGTAVNVYKFYNNDGTVPPTYKSNTFLGTHNHYRTSGASTMNAGDFDEIIADFQSHGYSLENGYEMVMMLHSTQGAVARTFKSTANGGTGVYDFIPAQAQPGAFITTTQQLIGQGRVADTLKGLAVIGSYGPMVIVQDDFMPSTHIFAFTTGGTLNLNNPVGLREHANPNLRGLRLVKGRVPNYPLIDSYWATGFGTGIRQRGAGMCMEITTNGTYTIPAVYQ